MSIYKGSTLISGKGIVDVDNELSTTSENPVQNKTVTNAINNITSCVYGTSTAVRVELGFKASAVIIADANSPTTLYVPNAISATAFACTAIPEGTARRYWAFK